MAACLFLQGDIVQKVLRIFLEYSESTSDLLDELACSILPQVCDFSRRYIRFENHK